MLPVWKKEQHIDTRRQFNFPRQILIPNLKQGFLFNFLLQFQYSTY
jgi:hypothetical protein